MLNVCTTDSIVRPKLSSLWKPQFIQLRFVILCRAGEESEKLSQEDCFQLLIQAQEILRKEYIQKQNKAREEIEKR